MVKELKIKNLKCEVLPHESSTRVAYLIYPAIEPFKNEWLAGIAKEHGVNIAVIYIPADGWNDMLTPWPEPGETPDSQPFGGKASETLDTIRKDVIPEIEKIFDSEIKERDLFGVSLSGLFTLWQWIQCDIFGSIGVLSGSFWYDGFMAWFDSQTIPEKSGKAYFLLGEKEPKAWIKAYRSVGKNTETVVERLASAGIKTQFEWVPGDHFADPAGRLEKAFSNLYK